MNTPEVEALEAEIVARISSLTNASTGNVRGVRREFSKRIVRSSPDEVIELAVRLIGKSEFLLRFVAYELVQHHKESSKSLDAKTLERLSKGLDSWAAVDTFACYLSGVAWREHQVTDKLIFHWARAKDRWRRRAALVSTVPLNNKTRGGSGDAARTLPVCEILRADRDDMVVKALSWALRELAKCDAEAVRAFLKEHGTTLAPRVIREVMNKLQTGLKNP